MEELPRALNLLHFAFIFFCLLSTYIIITDIYSFHSRQYPMLLHLHRLNHESTYERQRDEQTNERNDITVTALGLCKMAKAKGCL